MKFEHLADEHISSRTDDHMRDEQTYSLNSFFDEQKTFEHTKHTIWVDVHLLTGEQMRFKQINRWADCGGSGF